MIDPNKDVNEVCAFILAGKKNGCVILGGGSPKNFYLQGQPTLWEVYGIPKGGNDYFIQITTDSGRVGRAVGRDAGRGGELGQGQSRRAARHRRGLRGLDDRVSALLRVRRRLAATAAVRARSWCTSATSSSRRCASRQRKRRIQAPKPGRRARRADTMGTLASELGGHAEQRRGTAARLRGRERAGRTRVLHATARCSGTCCSCMEHDDLRRARDGEHYRLARQLRRTLITLDRDYLDDRKFPPEESGGVLVLSAPDENGLMALLKRLDREVLAARRSPTTVRRDRRRPCRSKAASCTCTSTGTGESRRDRPRRRRPGSVRSASSARARSIIDGGRIAAIERGVVDPAGATVVDASGLLRRARLHRRPRARPRTGTTRSTRAPVAQHRRAAAAYGVTAFCPTTVACAPDDAARRPAAGPPGRSRRSPVARVLPAHLESNFINPEYRARSPRIACDMPPVERDRGDGRLLGARHPRRDCSARPDVGIVTLAPELPGGIELVRALAAAGHRVSLGHSGADYDTAIAAIEAGARHATHLFNRMTPMTHRAPGLPARCSRAKKWPPS